MASEKTRASAGARQRARDPEARRQVDNADRGMFPKNPPVQDTIAAAKSRPANCRPHHEEGQNTNSDNEKLSFVSVRSDPVATR
jgi:hypothetical protein